MASVCVHSSLAYSCHGSSTCTETQLHARSFYLAVLYQFFRETSCDVRDISEDEKEGIRTLPVKLGKNNTLLLMAASGVLFDSLLTGSIAFGAMGHVHVSFVKLSHSVARVVLTILAHRQTLKYPRDSYLPWGLMSLLGLAPVLHAQAELRAS